MVEPHRTIVAARAANQGAAFRSNPINAIIKRLVAEVTFYLVVVIAIHYSDSLAMVTG
jgi:hypothetical protein